MKTITLFTLLAVIANFTFAQATTGNQAKSTINPNTIKQLIQLQQQQIQTQRQLLRLQQQALQLQRHLLKQQAFPISKQFKWVKPSKGSLPKNLINAGLSSGKKVYICHAKFRSFGVHPGMYTKQGCLISYGGIAYFEKKYALLTGSNKISWQPASALFKLTQSYYPIGVTGIRPLNSQPVSRPSKPIIGGHQKGRPIYICRALYHNEIHAGKVVRNYCNISWQGRELSQRNFEVLFNRS